MLCSIGRLPAKYRVADRVSHLAIHLAFAAVLSLGGGFIPTYAQSSAPLTLAEAEDRALDAEPGQAAFSARAAALSEQAVAAGQLPDPQLRVGLANYPIESGGFSTEGMTQAVLGVRQAFPRGKSRSLSAAKTASLATEMDRAAASRGRDVLVAVRQAWLDTHYWQRAESIVGSSRPLFSDLLTVTESLFAAGRAQRQDVLRAELELSRLDDRLIDIERQQANARAMLSQWIGDGAERPIAERLPEWNVLPPFETLEAALAMHPSLEAADARIDAQVAAVELAEQSYKPGWAVDVNYGYREGMLPSGEPRSDFVSVAFTVDLPIFRGDRQDRNVQAALGERRAAVDSKEALLRSLASRLNAEYARWREFNRRIDLYQRRILPQASEQSDAALAAYRSDAGDFADVMRAYIDELDLELELARLYTERAQSYAVIANLGGLQR